MTRFGRPCLRGGVCVRQLLAWVWFVCLLGVLVASNPPLPTYQTWLGGQIQRQVGTSLLGRLFADVAGAAVGRAPRTTRRDLWVATLYTTQVSGRSLTVLGVAGRFIPLRENGTV